MIRIAVIMGKMHSGGKKNLVMEYYRNIDKKTFQFDFICDNDSNSIPYEEIVALGGKVYQIAPYQNIIKNMKDIYSILKANDYKIIHGYNGTMNIFAMFVGFLAKVPVRINESISMAHRADKKTIIKNILKPFSRLFSTHYMANGVECGKWQFGQKLYNEGKVKVFKTVIDTNKNKYDGIVRDVTREKLNISDSVVFGHIGRLTSQKNTLFLIDIFNEIVKLEPTAKLLIIGDGDLKSSMLKKIEEYNLREKVLYLGRREDIQQFYNAMDCFLLPSLYEGLPVVGVEAQCCGLPTIFSTEVPVESSSCRDLGTFIDLSNNAHYWAKKAVEVANNSVVCRTDRSEDIENAGFSAKVEAEKLQEYYCSLL